MLTMLVVRNNGNEFLHSAWRVHRMWKESAPAAEVNAVVAEQVDGSRDVFEFDHDTREVFVMNAAGKTVARYSAHQISKVPP